MGTCYYLVRESDSALFDLGKWRPPEGWFGRYFLVPSHADLVALIGDQFAGMGYTTDETSEVARKLIEFAQRRTLVVLKDTQDLPEESFDDDGELRIAGSRFLDNLSAWMDKK